MGLRPTNSDESRGRWPYWKQMTYPRLSTERSDEESAFAVKKKQIPRF
jgi:hypothetical protein